jgi:hypothetical protein
MTELIRSTHFFATISLIENGPFVKTNLKKEKPCVEMARLLKNTVTSSGNFKKFTDYSQKAKGIQSVLVWRRKPVKFLKRLGLSIMKG